VTMLLVIVTPLAIYMAADSKQYPSGDNTEKIFLVGNDAIVMHSGIGLIPRAGESGQAWDAATEFRKSAESAPAGSFHQQLDYFRERVFGSFIQALARYSGAIPPDKKLTFMLAKRRDERTYVACQELPLTSRVISADRWSHRSELPAASILADGWENRNYTWWDIPVGCKMVSPDFSGGFSLVTISKVFKDVAAQSDMCSRQIGGPIRAATSDDIGARWLSD
jgi:hypothetical protein